MSPILSARGGMSAGAYGWGVASGGAVASFESIATANGDGSSGTITFSSIPSTFRHLQIRMLTRNNRAASFGSTYIACNSTTGTSYNYHALEADGANSAAFGGADSANIYLGDLPGSSGLTNTMGVGIITILDYANTTKNKTFFAYTGFDFNGSGKVGLFSGTFRSTSAISSLEITHSTTAGWTTTSTFALYGIKESA